MIWNGEKDELLCKEILVSLRLWSHGKKIDEYNQSGQPATNLQRKLNFLKMMVILLVNLATSVQRPVQICSAAQLF